MIRMPQVSTHRAFVAVAVMVFLVLSGAACTRTVNLNSSTTVNSNLVVNTAINQAANVNLPVVLPTNANTNSHTNTSTTNTNTSGYVTINVTAATGNPTLYDKQKICLRGYYQNSFEFVALSASHNANSRDILSPYIWLDVADSALANIELVCQGGTGNEEKVCYSKDLTSVCGVFHYSATKGLGHTGAYYYSLSRK